MGLRFAILIGFVSVSYLSLVGNIYNLQVRQGSYYGAKAASLYSSLGKIEPIRGGIYFRDRNGNSIPAAINKDYPTIFADNRIERDAEETASYLKEVLNLPEDEISKALSKKDDPYEPIAKRVSAEVAELISAAKLPGIYVDYESARFYPFKEMASQVLGYVSTEPGNQNGVYGVELYHNSKLRGENTVSEESLESRYKGEDVRLTIDRNIQNQAEKILSNLYETYGAEGGSIIVQDPKTGQIVAMANAPNFDPNNYGKYDIKSFLNPSLQAIYEPGSIMKAITMAAGIDSGAITPHTTYVDKGSVTLNKKTIKNANLKTYGRITMTNVLEHSVNTGAVFAETKMGHDTFYDYLVKFGFKEATGIDLPGEVVGRLQPLEKNPRDINFATASFGQGISVTPIALINAMSAIANDGIMMRPYVDAKKSPEPLGRIVREETSRQVAEMMVSGVNENKIAVINGYNVAGKTGTAQVPDFKRGGYTDEVINTFVGFAPAYDPRFVILVKLDKPYGAPQAGATIVPAFRELAEFILNYYNIPPDNISSRPL